MTLIILCILLGMNLLTFCLFGVDKRRAIKGRWRIPESTLLLFAFLGGSPGAWLGMRVFRHKTKHKKFTVLVPLFFVLQTGLVVWFFSKNIF